MTTTLYRPVCDLLGCSHSVVLAGMGGVARSGLVAAVTKAGGFGFLGMVREPVQLIRDEVAKLRDCGVHRFGVNLIPAATPPELLSAQIQACIELDVPVVALFWDLSIDIVRQLRDAGIIVVCQVGSAAEAIAAWRAGAQAIIAQGCEAGGHVRGDSPLEHVLPEIVAAVECPVLAAGGIVDGRDVATFLALGADGVVLGTALLATDESFAHSYHKQRLIAASGADTVLTDVFHINWPRGAKVRVLANSVTRGERGDPFGSPGTVIGDEQGRPIYLFSTDSPLRSMQGDFEAMALYAGMGAGRVTDIVGAGERLRRIVGEAAAYVEAGLDPIAHGELASPACFAREADDGYMGFASRDELLGTLNGLLEVERAGTRVCLHSAREVNDAALEAMVEEVRRDQVRWCNVLTEAVRTLGGLPSRQTDALHSEAMAISGPPQLLASLDSVQKEVVRRLRPFLPKVRDDALYGVLSSVLSAHERNSRRLAASLQSTQPQDIPG